MKKNVIENIVKGIANEKNIAFNLIDKSTVKGIKKRIKFSKDMSWNTKKLNRKLLTGIQNGDSINKITESFLEIIQDNEVSARRAARTMVTEAECSGRLDSYKELESMGVVQKKVWIATPDDRVRDEHLLMDGEEVDIDEEFSNGCMFPGDPSGDPSTVYNCRCSIKDKIIGFEREDGSISYVDYER